MRAAGVVLVGGRSSRMGTAKAALAWHGSTLLRRAVGVLGRVDEGPITVVRAPDQPLPSLDVAIDLREDPVADLGPLQGIAVGLAAARQRADVAFVCSVDVPLLHPAFIRAVLAALAEDPATEVALPYVGGHRQPLLAGYRTALAPRVAALLADGRRTPGDLLAASVVRTLDAEALRADPELAALDPALASVTNLNGPADLVAALALPLPSVAVVIDATAADAHAEAETDRPVTVHAATVGAAAAALGLTMTPNTAVTVDGRRMPPSPEEPLFAGEVVHLRPAP